MPQNIDPTRFEKITATEETSGTSKLRSRNPFITGINRYSPSQGNPLKKDFYGDFLSRLWAIFGPPNGVGYEGFYYALRDRETGLIFTAYVAGGGAAYGGFPKDASDLDPVFDLFEELLQSTKPVDCEIEFETDYGTYRTGAKNGVPFDEIVS